MKTNTKIEIGILVVASLFGIILQSYMRSSMSFDKEAIEELSGTFTEKTLDISSFSEIEISSRFKVEYRSGEPRVVVKTDESLLDEPVIEMNGNSLSIKDKTNNYSPSQNVKNASLITVYNDIDLTKISTYRSGRLKLIDSIRSENLEVFADGGSSTNGTVHVNSISIDSNGGSYIGLSGSSNTSTISTNGGARVSMEDHKTVSSKINANGGSGSSIYVVEEVVAYANGGARIKLFGTAKSVDTNSSGGGSVSRNFDK